MRSRVETLLFSLIAILCPLAYHPSFISSSGGISNDSVVIPLLAVIGTFSIYSIRVFGKNNRLIRFFFLSFVSISLEVIIFLVFGLNSSISEIVTVAECFIGILIGYNSSIKEKSVYNILRLYVIASLIIGVICVFQGLGSFEIVEQYLIVGKNASGVMVALAGAISFFMTTKDDERVIQILDYSFVFISLLVLMTIRARLALLSLIAVILLFLLKKRSFKLIVGVAISLSIVIIIFPDAFSYFYDSLFMSREEDFTTGRAALNKGAVDIIIESPIMGNLTHQYTFLDDTTVHNFVLKKLSDYGIIFSLPWILLYFYLLFGVVRSFIIGKSRDTIRVLSQLLIILLLLESIGEYTYPFGPGTITIIPFILLGYSERTCLLEGRTVRKKPKLVI